MARGIDPCSLAFFMAADPSVTTARLPCNSLASRRVGPDLVLLHPVGLDHLHGAVAAPAASACRVIAPPARRIATAAMSSWDTSPTFIGNDALPWACDGTGIVVRQHARAARCTHAFRCRRSPRAVWLHRRERLRCVRSCANAALPQNGTAWQAWSSHDRAVFHALVSVRRGG